MTASISAKQWMVLVVVNVIVSGITSFFVFRSLVNQANSVMPPLTPAAAAESNALGPAVSAPSATRVMTDAPGMVSPTVAISATALPGATATVEAAAVNTASATRTPTPQARPVPTATVRTTRSTSAAPTAAAPKLKISSVLFPGQLAREVIVIVNLGDRVDMKGWTLSASPSITYTFPNVSLFKDDFINLHTTSGADNPTDLFWNRTQPAWKVNDTIVLSKDGVAITQYTVK